MMLVYSSSETIWVTVFLTRYLIFKRNILLMNQIMISRLCWQEYEPNPPFSFDTDDITQGEHFLRCIHCCSKYVICRTSDLWLMTVYFILFGQSGPEPFFPFSLRLIGTQDQSSIRRIPDSDWSFQSRVFSLFTSFPSPDHHSNYWSVDDVVAMTILCLVTIIPTFDHHDDRNHQRSIMNHWKIGFNREDRWVEKLEETVVSLGCNQWADRIICGMCICS